ncbi:MAG: transcriptional regulator [Halobacteria archaeon]|nr:transcriptional regulator [Halobacteria archaeon]
MRDRLVEETVKLLRQTGFDVSDTCNIRPKSFDVVARRSSIVVLVKVLSNIDGFDPHTADEMKRLSDHLDASSLIIGERTRDDEMEESVVYLRHGIPAVSLKTADDFFRHDLPPLVYMAPGGLYVSLNGDVLSEERKSEEMSLGQVAREIGVSRRSVSKYEDGMDATVDVALKLEEIFDKELTSPIDILSIEETEREDETDGAEDADIDQNEVGEKERVVFERLDSAGFRVLPTSKAPFRAVSRTRERDDDGTTILTGISRYSKTMVKRAKLMSSISDVAGSSTESLYVVETSERESIDDTAVLEREELEEIRGSDELLEDVYERKTA